MLDSNDRIVKHKLGLLNLANELGNLSKARKMVGASRDAFYRYKEALDDGGIEPLIDPNRFESVEELQADPGDWLDYCKNEPTHQGKKCYGTTPMDTWLDGKRIWMEKFVN